MKRPPPPMQAVNVPTKWDRLMYALFMTLSGVEIAWVLYILAHLILTGRTP